MEVADLCGNMKKSKIDFLVINKETEEVIRKGYMYSDFCVDCICKDNLKTRDKITSLLKEKFNIENEFIVKIVSMNELMGDFYNE